MKRPVVRMFKKPIIFIISILASAVAAEAQQLALPAGEAPAGNYADLSMPDLQRHIPAFEMRDLRSVEADKEREAIVSDLLDYAHTFRGIRYRRGGSSPKGFDCSGFTSFVFGQFGYALSRSSRAQATQGELIDKSEVKPGDLLFFTGRGVRGSNVGHVGIAISMDEESGEVTFIHSACSSGITVSKTSEPYYAKRYLSARRVIE